MNAIRIAPRAAAIVAALALTIPAAATAAGTAKELEGTWQFVSNTNIDKDGKRSPGASRHGLITFTPEGRYMAFLSNGDVKPFAANSRNKGTPEENKAAVEGSIAHVGRYTVDEKAGTIALDVEACTYPNWAGTKLSRRYAIDGDTVVIANSARSANDGSGNEITYKRVK